MEGLVLEFILIFCREDRYAMIINQDGKLVLEFIFRIEDTTTNCICTKPNQSLEVL
jgi:hypothetical protein